MKADKNIKSKEIRYPGFSYIAIRQQYLNSIGQFRCFAEEEGKERCSVICSRCEEYYVDVEKK